MNKKIILSSLLFLSLFTFSATTYAITWKSIFIAGDDSIDNFDNGREDLYTLFSKLGKVEAIHLSSSRERFSKVSDLYPATVQNIATAFRKLNVQPQDEGCLIHMTSHGIQGQGFYLSLGGGLTPRSFAALVNNNCKNVPTVIMVSACYSGQFITEDLKGPNRIIMTAARADRPSFGCSPDTRYTYWDGCLLDEVPRSQTWAQLEQRMQACISRKEMALGVPSSGPQTYFGTNTKNWGILK